MPDFVSTIGYLARDEQYLSEKPYDVVFDISGIPNAEKTNHKYTRENVTVHDLRDSKLPNLDRNGFTLVQSDTSLTYKEFGDDEAIREKYYPEIAAAIRELRPECTSIVILDHEIRKREQVFPEKIGAETTTAQPLTMPHVDFSPTGGRIRLTRTLTDKRPDLLTKRYELLNVWRLLKGPNDDWPLALCDWETVDSSQDQVANDIVYADDAGENFVLHPSPAHKWYYLSGQDVNDVFVFRACGTESNDTSRAFHVAVKNPLACSEGPFRESVDVRLVAFYDE